MSRFFRKWHRWVSVVVAAPFLVIVVTGLLLASRGFNTWVQPAYPRVQTTLDISFAQILQVAQSFPQAEIHSWSDVAQIDIRPASGNIRVRAKKTQWEILIDGGNGRIIGTGLRRASWLTSLHEGAYFGELVRYGLFFPSALGVFFLLVSGMIIFALPYMKKNSFQKVKK